MDQATINKVAKGIKIFGACVGVVVIVSIIYMLTH